MAIRSINTTEKQSSLYKKFHQFILSEFHPCVMARAAFMNQKVDFHRYSAMDNIQDSKSLLQDLSTYIETATSDKRSFYSFIAAFPSEQIESEVSFEKKLWKQLQILNELDPLPWDKSVSSDPNSHKFSFSLLGKSFYVVGMHPESSRNARKAPCPALVFNLHSQFEQLREMGVYSKVKDQIRARDKKWQGSNNPMLDDFGKNSEAKQYSGRAVDDSWKCPFHNKM